MTGDLYLLLISEVLDHDAQIANMFLNEMLRGQIAPGCCLEAIDQAMTLQ